MPMRMRIRKKTFSICHPQPSTYYYDSSSPEIAFTPLKMMIQASFAIFRPSDKQNLNAIQKDPINHPSFCTESPCLESSEQHNEPHSSASLLLGPKITTTHLLVYTCERVKGNFEGNENEELTFSSNLSRTSISSSTNLIMTYHFPLASSVPP